MLREALALWRGPPLADLAFEPFAQAEIARLEEQRLAALEARVEADLAAGRHAALVGELQRLVAANPTRERLAGQLMLALYRCGRQAEALEAYRDARRRLVADVGVEPGPELRRLQEAILHQDASLELQPAVAELPRELDAATAPPLVGRERRAGVAAGALGAGADGRRRARRGDRRARDRQDAGWRPSWPARPIAAAPPCCYAAGTGPAERSSSRWAAPARRRARRCSSSTMPTRPALTCSPRSTS